MFGKMMAVGTMALVLATTAQAETFQVKMLNKGTEGSMVFEPAYINAQVGDTVVFLPADKGHNVESIDDMLPEGVEEFKGKMNSEYTLTLDKEGLYGVKCKPHYMMGMVALIQAGAATNLAEASAAKKKGKAKAKFETLLEQVQ